MLRVSALKFMQYEVYTTIACFVFHLSIEPQQLKCN